MFKKKKTNKLSFYQDNNYLVELKLNISSWFCITYHLLTKLKKYIDEILTKNLFFTQHIFTELIIPAKLKICKMGSENFTSAPWIQQEQKL